MASFVKCLSCVSFNCLGFKSSIIDKLCSIHDICFLSEHWLRPCELPTIQGICNQKSKWSHFKSSVDPEIVTSGRPHGGVAFICKKKNSVSYKVLNVNSDRVCAIQVINNHNVVCTIIGVYMPYFRDSSEQTELVFYCMTLSVIMN